MINLQFVISILIKLWINISLCDNIFVIYCVKSTS